MLVNPTSVEWEIFPGLFKAPQLLNPQSTVCDLTVDISVLPCEACNDLGY